MDTDSSGNGQPPLKPLGSATVVTPSGESLVLTDGPCLLKTLLNLETGLGSRPLSRQDLSRSRGYAQELLEDVVDAYEREVGLGEVGATGSRRASPAAPRAGVCPTGLLYGRVQSGKTVAMIILAAMAIDNGFRVVVVFTSNYLKLVQQTTSRFRALAGPLVHSSTRLDALTQDMTHVKKNLERHGLVIVCAKDPKHIRTVGDLLREVGAADYPGLILDDEADQATLDTTLSARSANRPNAPAYGSAIYRGIVRDDSVTDVGDSVREILRHNVYVQVTATPYALLLQNIDSPLRPKFTCLLEPGDGYAGGESFFAVEHVAPEGGAPPLIFVDEEESDELASQRGETAPVGLARSISFFLLSSSAQLLLNPSSRTEGQNFLCHTSPRTVEHDKLGRLIRDFLGRLEDDLDRPEIGGENRLRLEWAYRELRRSISELPPLDTLLAEVRARLHLRQIYIVNSAASDAEFDREMNFIVGGNILGRGLTIDNLLVTYYLRRARTTQMDTMLQHARMFGYRRYLMPFTRVFLPESLALRFHHIHVAEAGLRELLADPSVRSKVPVQAAGGLRATRRNVLDTGSLGAFRAGEHLYPIAPVFRRSEIGGSTDRLDRTVKDLTGTLLRPKFEPIEIEEMIELIRLVKVSEEDSFRWDEDAISNVLRSIASRYGGKGYLFSREMVRSGRSRYLSTGAASGAELQRALGLGAPALLLFRDPGTSWEGVPFWYPSLVFPLSMPNQVFNLSE